MEDQVFHRGNGDGGDGGALCHDAGRSGRKDLPDSSMGLPCVLLFPAGENCQKRGSL